MKKMIHFSETKLNISNKSANDEKNTVFTSCFSEITVKFLVPNCHNQFHSLVSTYSIHTKARAAPKFHTNTFIAPPQPKIKFILSVVLLFQLDYENKVREFLDFHPKSLG